ncbi:MAG: hypothetical protein U9Q80_09285 [Bacillota bacterium]|nr:hypothetical protein [Bacillota bacterium]
MSKRVVYLMMLILIIAVASGCAKEEALSLSEEFMQMTSGEFIIDEPGVYGYADEIKEFEGNIHVKTDGVILQNVNVAGDIILAEEIGEGDVELIDLNISNTVFIYGGGENSIRYKRTRSKHTLVYKPRKPVRIVVDKESKIDVITVQSSVILEGDSFSRVSIEPKEENTNINLIGTFKEVEVKGTAHVFTSEKTHIENMIIDEHAKKMVIDGDGSVFNVEVNAKDVHINVRVENAYSNNNINRVVINNEETNINIDAGEIYHTADTWEVGMPWDPEWGEEPEGAWQADSGVPWNPEWGTEPDDLDLPEEEMEVIVDGDEIYHTADTWEAGMPWDPEWGEEPEGAWQSDSGVPWNPEWGPEPDDLDLTEEELEIIIDSDEVYHTADTWEAGMPWDPEWGEEPEGAWQPDSGVPWDPDWGPEPDDLNLPEEIDFEFITCNYIATSNPNNLEITISLTKPGTVYYVFEDISVMFGLKYLPSADQVMQGNNALGSPDPKAKPDTGDDDFEFFTEAFVSGQILVDEADKEYKVVIDGPTFPGMEGETFMDSPSGFRGSVVAVDEDGNEIIEQ